MLKIIRTRLYRMVVMCLLGIATASPAIADESLSDHTVPPRNIRIAQIETTFAVDPNAPEVSPEYVKALALEYFADMPEMIAIAECESGFKQYREDGTLNVNRDTENGKRISSAAGVFQILYLKHYDSWAGSAETNITTVEGNFAKARAMRLASGSTSDWDESIGCWGPIRHKYEQRVADATS